jgi:hypothetical protein
MAGHDAGAAGFEVALDQVLVGSADAATAHPQPELARAGLRRVTLNAAQRPVRAVDRPGVFDNPCVHALILRQAGRWAHG